jgi:hypothetical protein
LSKIYNLSKSRPVIVIDIISCSTKFPAILNPALVFKLEGVLLAAPY